MRRAGRVSFGAQESRGRHAHINEDGQTHEDRQKPHERSLAFEDLGFLVRGRVRHGGLAVRLDTPDKPPPHGPVPV